MQNYIQFFGLLVLSLFLFSCTVDNDGGISEIEKNDFSQHNYVLATEDASDVDITTFFSFDLEAIEASEKYDLFDRDDIFVNSNPSTSSGQLAFGPYVFSQAKDKKGFSSNPGLYRLTLNEDDQMFIDAELNVSQASLFPPRQIAMLNEHEAYFYNEGKDPYKIQIFDPTEMYLTGSIDLEPIIKEFKPFAKMVDEAGNNLVRTGAFALEVKEGKLYASISYLQEAAFSHISDVENKFYAAVIDIKTREVEKIITYHGAKNVGFYVSENKATSVDESGNLYFAAWGWNQFNYPFPSQVFRVPAGKTDFDEDWKIDIEKHFGEAHIVQSMMAFHDKLYLHISQVPYGFSVDENVRMKYYEVDPNHPDQFKELEIPASDHSDRMNVFSIVDDQLFVAVPNVKEGRFNGFYTIDKSGEAHKAIRIDNKYRPTRLYKLGE